MAATPVNVGPDCQDTPMLMRLLPIAGSTQIMLTVVNDSEELYHSLWDGNVFLDDPPFFLSDMLTSKDRMPFDLSTTETLGSGLIAHYKLDEGSGQTAADST